MVTAQVEFTEAELLADPAVTDPLIARLSNGTAVRCHGGFDADGSYLSPRTRFRTAAIEAWTEKNTETFGTEPIDVPLERWEKTFPSVEQAKFLIRSGVPEPLMATLTRIGTVEGYGANIRLLKPTDLQRHFVEDLRGTATDHLGRGLFEAHGRDEAGLGEADEQDFVAGHRDMWFAARDIAFDRPVGDIDVSAMLERMGVGQGAGASAANNRRLPDDISGELEVMLTLMIRVLFIEISAFHTFAWAEDWMSDPDLVAGAGKAAKLVSYIRADETPHVGYLRAAVSEMRDRTWVGKSGRKYDGAEMVAAIWDPLLTQSLGPMRDQGREATLREVEHWCGQKSNGSDVLAEFVSLSSIDQGAA